MQQTHQADAPDPDVPSRRARRLDPDKRLGLELTLWAAAAFVVLVPFGVLLVLVRSHSTGLQGADQHIAADAHNLAVAHHWLVTFLQDVSTYGAPRTFWVLVGLAAVALLVKRAARLALWAGVTMAGAALLDNVIKTLANRARPHFSNPVASAPGASFPSGHALESLVGCLILLAIAWPLIARGRRWIAVGLAATVVVVIGFARVILGVHYPSDVIGGWIFAAGWVAATAAAFRIWRKREEPGNRSGTLDPEASERLVSP